MQKRLILLSLINKNDVAAIEAAKEVIEAAVFLAIRYGAKKMMIVHADTYQLLAGEEAYKAAVDKGDTEAEVLLCNPASTDIAHLAALNADKLNTALKTEKKYEYVSPWEFERDKEHIENFKYGDADEFESTDNSFKKYDRLKPVFYIEYQDGDKVVRAVVDGWKYILFARRKGMEKIFACKLIVGNNDDLLSIMFQLQRTNHDSFMALFTMIQALWPKFYKGSGYRSDMKDDEIEKGTIEDVGGRQLNIYQRIGLELNLSGNHVKHIRKVGMVDDVHFDRIAKDRFSLYQAYLECIKEESGELAPVPAIKEATYHTTTTDVPKFGKPDSTANVEGHYMTDDEIDGEPAQVDEGTGKYSHDDIPAGTIVAVTDEYVIVRGVCQCCNRETFLKVYKKR